MDKFEKLSCTACVYGACIQGIDKNVKKGIDKKR